MRAALLLAATGGTGLVAGLFLAFSVAVLPGLRTADARTFVDVMQRINLAIVNPVFLVLFLGSPLLLIVVTATGERPWPLLVSAALTLAALVVTFAVNIPLNSHLAVASLDDATGARAAFERTWTLAHQARTLLMSVSFAGALAALRTG